MKNWLPFLKSDPTVAVIRLSGVIGGQGRGVLNDATLGPVIDKAFSKGKPAAVALEINSPGGSPVQSSLIGARIRRLAEEKNIPVIAFVEDVAASGGYWLAAAADEIYADPSSVVGSIGVISASFGLSEFITNHGIERRVYTAGKSKSMLDPFRPAAPQDVARLKTLLEDVHGNFKDHITARRAGKLPEDQDLFTGEVWLAKRATELGLIEGIGHLKPFMKERFGKKVRFRSYAVKRGFFSRFSTQVVQDAVQGIEERAAYARFGL
ncbi:S49 family peptidase [Sulfitobacter sp. M57]|uniref:S49 family peptidase n=1 Tax=unclassified Sulfitobacter TaxID=196795 RepID=UPI0023E21CF1|nr:MULTISPECIES: S49 family peptidase [unclassified Sulfitobacter]MDF3415521.1 S49 family peptidase [Sulfitobacter sp. KE5]MDF3423002.1 S49 family peptidase [Sulfitobacter sp. KE43]MDF3434067.1 S49 family peptidase [Sulfitobacter sp. KE42]MDF3459900.1 S49 family peptidase [Sulfitobacter sp. S74]MDF3463606.1 S49 family peptidase [Sulfitobacter sp. Ks18]